MAKAGSTEKVVREIRRPTRASQTNAVEGVLTGALGRPGRLRSVHGCGGAIVPSVAIRFACLTRMTSYSVCAS